MTVKDKPILIQLDSALDLPHPAEAPEISDAPAPMTQISQTSGAGLWGWVVGLIGATIAAYVTLGLWDFAVSLIQRNDCIGWGFAALLAATLATIIAAILREFASLWRLKNLDQYKTRAHDLRLANDPQGALQLVGQLKTLYGSNPVAVQKLDIQLQDQFDAFAILDVAEQTLMPPLDAAASGEVERAARQVATVTALMPLAFADVAVAFTTNVRMIRRIGEIYGGRGGLLSSIRLLRSVMAHLVATGAVAIGDDFLGSIFGGSLLAKLSRRFGEGMINGALTARVGRAAIEVCRPLPFHTQQRPSVTTILRRALGGVFDKSPEA